MRFKVAVGKGEVHRSTGCRDYRLAKIVAAELAAHWHRAIQALERMDITKVKAGSIKLLGDGFIPLNEAAATLGSTPLALGNQLAARNAHFYVEAKDWLGWPVADLYATLDHVSDELGRVEVVFDEEKLGGKQAQTRFSGHLRLRFNDEGIDILKSERAAGVCQFLPGSSQDVGFICDLPGQSIDASMLEVRKIDVETLRSSIAGQVTPEMLAVEVSARSLAHSTTKPEHLGTTSETGSEAPKSMTFSAFFAEYMLRNSSSWKADQKRRRNDQGEIFTNLMGDVPLNSISRSMMRRFADLIKTVPHDRHLVKMKYKCLGANFNELIALADKHGLKRFSVNSQHRLLDGMSEMFNWAVTETMMTINPAVGLGGEVVKHSGVAKVKAHDQRDALSPEDLKLIFSANWFAKGTGNKTAKGDFYSYRPYYYWLPLLALYGGGRLNELSQLYVDDVKLNEGVAFLHFNLEGEDKLDADEAEPVTTLATDKSLKTMNSERFVPIHQKLLDLGFLEFVSELRSNHYTRLFPELTFNPTKGYGKAAGAWFNDRFLGAELKIARTGRKTFHSLRHNFATALGTARVPDQMSSDFMGHKRTGSMTKIRYDKGAIEGQKAQIDLIKFDLPNIEIFNISDGLKAIKDALKLKKTRIKRVSE